MRKTKGCTRGRLAMATTAAVLAAFAPVRGAVQTFTSTTDTDLTNGANYTPSGAPNNTSDLLFDTGDPTAAAIYQTGVVGASAATNLTVQSINDLNLNAITIGNNSTGAGSAAVLTLGNPTAQNNLAGGSASDLIYIGGATSAMTIQGANLKTNGNSSGTGTFSITLAQSGNINVANAGASLLISSAINGASSDLTKTGLGTLTLNGTNTFNSLTIKSGVVQDTAFAANSFGTGTITIGDTGGSADAELLTNVQGSTVNFANNIVIAAGSTGTLTLGAGASTNGQTFSGTITLNNNLTLTSNRFSHPTNFTGQISGSSTITVNGTSGTAITNITNASNASTFSGNIVIGLETLEFSNNAIGGTTSFQPGGAIGSIAFNGAGTLQWGAGNTQDISFKTLNSTGFTGALDTNGNSVTFATVNGLTGSGNFTKSGGTGTLTLSAANDFSGTYTATAGVTLLGDANALQNATVNETVTGALAFANIAGHAFNFGALSGSSSTTLALTDVASNAVSLTVGSNNASTATAATTVISGTGSITKVGTGTLTLASGSSTFSGGLNIAQGTLALTSSQIITAGTLVSSQEGTGAVTLGSGTNAVTLQTNAQGSTTRTISNMLVLSGDVSLTSTATSGRIAFDTTSTLTTPNTITLTRTNTVTNGPGVIVDLIGAIGDGGNNYGLNLTTTTGTWNIGGSVITPTDARANTYTGLTDLNGGTLNLNKTAGTTAIAGNIQIDAGSLMLSSSNQIADTANVNVTKTGALWTLQSQTETIGSLTVGVIGTAFTGNAVSGSNGTLIVTGAANVYAGGVNVKAMTTGTGGLTVGDGVTMTSIMTYGGDITYMSTLGASGTGASVGGGSAMTLNGNRTVTVADGNATNDLILTGPIGDGSVAGSSITKTGAGNLVFVTSGINSFSGGLNIQQGQVTGGAGATTFGTGGIVLGVANSSNNATLAITSSGTYANAISTALNSTGLLTLSGASGNPAFSGGITLNNANLQLAFSGSSVVVISGPGVTGTGNFTINSTPNSGIGMSITGTINNSGVFTNNETPATGINNITVSGALGGQLSGVVQNSASSTLLIAATNANFTGATTVSAGTLKVGGNDNLGQSNVTVGAAGTLELTSATSLSDASTLTVATGGVLKLDFTYTKLANDEVVNSLILGGVSFGPGAFFDPSNGYTFNGNNESAFFSGTGGINVVPEPTSIGLIGLGAGGLLRRRRRGSVG